MWFNGVMNEPECPRCGWDFPKREREHWCGGMRVIPHYETYLEQLLRECKEERGER
jgi:hypothetical protein